MAFVLHQSTGWVDTDGSYGVSDLITFNEEDLTSFQWQTLSELSDNDRIEYVSAIMNDEPLDEWENN
jgi:hypothetical protein